MNSTASTEDGTKSAPYKTLQAGVDKAYISQASQVLVAAGTYDEMLAMRPGVAVRGGYEATNWTRNIASNVTRLHSPGSAGVLLANIPQNKLQSTVVSGLTIRTQTPGSTGIQMQSAYATIEDNTISVSSGSTQAGTATAISVDASYPIIRRNFLRAMNAWNTSGSTGIAITNNGRPEITNNIILAFGYSDNYSYGISHNNLSSSLISNNLLLTHHSTIPLFSVNATNSVVITNNMFVLQRKYPVAGTLTEAIVEANSAANTPRSIENNAFWPVVADISLFYYLDRPGSGIFRSLSQFEALIDWQGGSD